MWLELLVWIAIHLAALHALQDGTLAPADEVPTRRTKWRRAVFASIASAVALVGLFLVFAVASVAAVARGLGPWFLLLAFPLGTLVDALVFRRVFGVTLWRALRGSAIAVAVANIFTGLLQFTTYFVGGAVLARPIAMGVALALILAAGAFVRARTRRQASRFADVASAESVGAHLDDDEDAEDLVEAMLELERVRDEWESRNPAARVRLRPRALAILSGALLAAALLTALVPALRVELDAVEYATERRAEHEEVVELGPGVASGGAWQPITEGLEGRWRGRTLYLRDSGSLLRAEGLGNLGLLAFAALVAGLAATIVGRARLHRELTLAALAAALSYVVVLGLRAEGGLGALFGSRLLAWDPHLALVFPALLLPLLVVLMIPAAAWVGGGVGWTLTRWSISARRCARCGANGPWSRGGDCLTCGYSGAELGDAARVLLAAATLTGVFALLLFVSLPDLDVAIRCTRASSYGDELCRDALAQLRYGEAFDFFATWIPFLPSPTLAPVVDESAFFLHRWALLGLGAVAFFAVGAGLARSAARRPLAVGAAGVVAGWLGVAVFGLPMLGGLSADPTGAALPTLLLLGLVWVGSGLVGALRGFRLRRAEDAVA